MGNFIMPVAVISVVAETWGDGGDGIGVPSSGAGGGGGAYARDTVAVIPGDTYSVDNAGTFWRFRWNNGSTDLVYAASVNAFFGSDIGGKAVNSLGSTKYDGGDGFNTFPPPPAPGGGGASGATRNAPGNNGSQPFGAISPVGGGGGDGGVAIGVAGLSGQGPAPGGGGGGAYWQNGNGDAAGLKREGGGVVWRVEDWDFGTNTPVVGAIPIYSNGNFEPVPLPPIASGGGNHSILW
jgi:fibronectin-binding autotransporter adhesin